MSNNTYVEQIRLPLVNNYIKTIRSLASFGRNYYQKYMIQPLSSWSDTEVSGDITEITGKIKLLETQKKHQSLPNLYKTALIKSVANDQFDMSLPGNIALDFLKLMKDNVDICRSTEALQFVNLLYKPFKDFNDIQFKKMNAKFEKEIQNADDKEVLALAEIGKAEKVDIDKEKEYAEKKLSEIKASVAKKSSADVKREILSFLLQVATPKDPTLHRIIFPLMQSIEAMNPSFTKDIMDTLAILIYFEVTKTIKSGNLKKTFLFISKYTVLFRGVPETPNFEEIDAFEKKFFDLLDKRNLWDSL